MREYRQTDDLEGVIELSRIIIEISPNDGIPSTIDSTVGLQIEWMKIFLELRNSLVLSLLSVIRSYIASGNQTKDG
ncbi:hypothetical protein SNEBB_001084 [Seison nebaliae]|nr:hypothetical protein SNEBB_001084 [Seison nebaliae]